MTDCSNEDGSYLVRVRAQVMARDDSTGGWVPMGGGGLSLVSVRKRLLPPVTGEDSSAPSEPRHEYLIYGKRLSDQAVVLSCTIKKDFQYNRVMPTFHHWKTGDKKFGLTFTTASDARAFNKGVRIAVEDLLDGPGLLQFHETDLGDDDVFMTVDLPVDSHSSSGSSGPAAKPASPGTKLLPPSVLNGSGISDIPTKVCPEEVWTGATEPYVHFNKRVTTAEHEYEYPVVESPHKPLSLTTGPSKKPSQVQPPLLPTKGKKPKHLGSKPLRHEQAQCYHCLDRFSEDNNPRGACEYAPDPVLACIDRVTCLRCAQAMLYHCAADPEAADLHPCSPENRSCGRWAGLGLLSLLLPCLWCYLPLRACHRCGVACGLCGARHQTFT